MPKIHPLKNLKLKLKTLINKLNWGKFKLKNLKLKLKTLINKLNWGKPEFKLIGTKGGKEIRASRSWGTLAESGRWLFRAAYVEIGGKGRRRSEL